jgi:hypothetical protein
MRARARADGFAHFRLARGGEPLQLQQQRGAVREQRIIGQAHG